MDLVTMPRLNRFLALAFLAIALTLTACAGPKPGPSPASKGAVSGTVTPSKGIASWYGPKFHGRRTANGEVYNMYALTAAHRFLPFGTRVQVTNLDNGRHVQVRINDRGPFVKNRIIDLSYSAARRIDMVGTGTAPVRLRLIQGPDRSLPKRYFVQTGSFTRLDNAQRLLARLKKQGYKGSRKVKVRLDGQTYWRVQAGSFPTLASARESLEDMRRENPACFIIAD
jgi:rare lipoprotein A